VGYVCPNVQLVSIRLMKTHKKFTGSTTLMTEFVMISRSGTLDSSDFCALPNVLKSWMDFQ